MTSGNSLSLRCPDSMTDVIEKVEIECKETSNTIMSHLEEDEPRVKEQYTENDLKEAIRRINAGEINLKEAENVYGISPRTIHRQRAIENMRAQLNPEKVKKVKPATNSAPKKDVTILRKPMEIGCSTLSDVANLLNSGTEEVKQLLTHECDIIYECKICKNLFRSLANFISHKRVYCCDMYSVIHVRSDENDDESGIVSEDQVKEKENIKEFSTKPFRVTCRKDLTSVLKKISNIAADLLPTEPILHLQTLENATCAFQQVLFTNKSLEKARSKASNENEEEISEILPSIHPEKTRSSSTDKSDEKSSHSEKHFVAEKRFRCPVCLSNFTIKRSVLRHLKSVHHKSIEQVEKLKSRIQVHFVRIRNNSIDFGKDDKNTTANSKSNSDSKGWEKTCIICNRKFTNKTLYSNHLKSCRRTSSRADSSNTTSPKKTLIPVVSLTPIATTAYIEKSESDDSVSEPAPSKKSSSSKKVALPMASSSNSQSKKIGIQVRMNYCKDSGSAPNSANVTPTSYGASITPTQSNDNSRRNSVVSVKDMVFDDIPKVSHNTRSGSKLNNILETLIDKRNRERDSSSVRSSPSDSKKCEINITIYCNSCRKVYSLNDFNCDVTNENIKRSYRCVLRDCDFQAHRSSELLPHLLAKHSELTESDLINVRSIFAAEFVDENGFTSLGDCKRRPVLVEKPVDSKLKRKNGSDASTNSVDSVGEQTLHSLGSSNKRKPACNSNKSNVLKRKVVNDEEIIKNNDVKIKAEENEEILGNIDDAVELYDVVENIKTEVKEVDSCELDNSPTNKSPKKIKKDDDKSLRTKKKDTVDSSPNQTIANGIIISSSSSDEENDKTQANSKSKNIHNKMRTSNIPTIGQKLWRTPQKMSLNSFHNELSPSSSTPDSDLDHSMMTDEIMTIIFGKGMSAEKVEENVSCREKSPTSSSSSSDCGKEKRYSFRIAKQCTQIKTGSVESKDDKTSKSTCLNKIKPSSR